MGSKSQLFKRPSFWEGFLRAFDLFGVYSTYNPEDLPDEEIDYEAMKSDWDMVGYDLQTAINQHEEEIKENRY
jgi:hypothetical protein